MWLWVGFTSSFQMKIIWFRMHLLFICELKVFQTKYRQGIHTSMVRTGLFVLNYIVALFMIFFQVRKQMVLDLQLAQYTAEHTDIQSALSPAAFGVCMPHISHMLITS